MDFMDEHCIKELDQKLFTLYYDAFNILFVASLFRNGTSWTKNWIKSYLDCTMTHLIFYCLWPNFIWL